MLKLRDFIEAVKSPRYKRRYEEALARVMNENLGSAGTDRSVEDILKTYVAMYPNGNASEKLISVLDAADLLRLDTGCWDDTYDILGYLPPCPSCRVKMKYCNVADLLQCPHCGYTVEGSKYPYRSMPSREGIKETDYLSYEEITDEESR